MYIATSLTIGEAGVAVAKESISQTIRWILDRIESDHWSLLRVEQVLNLALDGLMPICKSSVKKHKEIRL